MRRLRGHFRAWGDKHVAACSFFLREGVIDDRLKCMPQAHPMPSSAQDSCFALQKYGIFPNFTVQIYQFRKERRSGSLAIVDEAV